MEEINDDPFQINNNRADARKSVIPDRFYMNKKRKFQDISGLPLPKHLCTVRTSEQHPENGSSKKWTDMNEDGGEGKVNHIESRGSGKDSNYFFENDNSSMSVSSDWPSTSAVNWGGCSSSSSFFTVNSTSETKSIESGGQLQYIHYEDQLLEYGKYVDCDSTEYEYDGIEVCKDKELEDLLLSDGGNEKNFILSSGRWNVNQETQQETKKLTIDKEFEQYFSELML